MRWWTVLGQAPLYAAWLRAAWTTARYGSRPVSKWCDAPARCPLKHKIVFVAPPGKPWRAGLKHVEGV